ncbi:MAG: hypothetical protein ISR61_10670 [Desulfobacteraceae bacterium]|uniref:AMP-binding enzyme C-terminal domain-containing protein n=1 Tax=Candidatus Desulfacyla euxinica TaxID=2841693 RepID=A0A8J6MYR8_9DELT|nr:hypothetical protein [Candidatus Desulfacyla euxinica]MBL6979402.1 hypothetical protein [Desulfobacteraceae bacterium]
MYIQELFFVTGRIKELIIKGGEIMACVTVKPGLSVTEEELLNHCLEHLWKFKTPKMIKIMDELPKGPSGKIQRLKLPDLVIEER